MRTAAAVAHTYASVHSLLVHFRVALKLWDNAVSYDVYVLDCAICAQCICPSSGGTAVRVGHYGPARVAPGRRLTTCIKKSLPLTSPKLALKCRST